MEHRSLVIAGLGPGDPALVPERAIALARSAKNVVLRTENHPAVERLIREKIVYTSFDSLYETAESFEELYQEIARKVIEFSLNGDTVYMVPGHPLLAEKSVEIIIDTVQGGSGSQSTLDRGNGIVLEIVPAMGFAEAVISALRRPVPSGYLLVDAYDLIGDIIPEHYRPEIPCIVFQVHDKFLASAVKLWLLEYLPADYTVYIVKGACVPGKEEILPVSLEDLDRTGCPDPLTSVFVPACPNAERPGARYGAGSWARFMSIVARLRGENGCPWDKQQTYETLTRFVVEEAYEVVSSVLEKDVDKLKEELGDLLLEVGLYCQIAKERGDFTAEEVLKGISEKLVRRHPHVFAGEKIGSPEEVEERWAEIKRQEPGRYHRDHSLMDEVDKGLPALMKAQKQQRLAAEVGFDWENAGAVFDKVREELEELREAVNGGDKRVIASEIGDLLYACVNLARHLGVDAEVALLGSIEKFSRRFREMEKVLKTQNLTMKDVDMDFLDRLWEKAKECEEGVE
ncbi:MAG TPA: nucleoside triphosphate pyrophosphohydrolase [Firmicutes bacterium]|nr:nucleoside triphosphate pyrophosphohydrolase [Candidatus Fermentithermobacillaceae bacterium]